MGIPYFLNKAKLIRKAVLLASYRAQTPHIGSCFSCVDILTYLYFKVLKLNLHEPKWPNRDRFILSKGHAALALYATLTERRFFSASFIKAYTNNGTKLAGHPVFRSAPGIEATSGSLGHGLAIALGIALAGKKDHKKYRVFAMLSDGECDEGSVWESVMAASQLKLDNLVAIIDYNKIQSFGTVKEVMDLEPFAKKWQAFGWTVKEINGHNFKDIEKAFSKIPFKKGKPSVIIAHTIKGRGVSFMENKLEWHYKNLTEDLLTKALNELV